MISPDDKRAIALIKANVGNKVSRGTGFLVSTDGLVLTAFHVVGDLATGKKYAEPMKLSFGDPREGPTIESEARFVPDHHSVADDWALLRCTTPPAGVTPLKLGRIRRRYALEFESFGFTEAKRTTGMVYAGKVRSSGRRMQLFSDEAAAVASERVSGLSGAPCIVDGYAAGIVQTSNMEEIQPGVYVNREGALYMLPVEIVARACELLKVPVAPPPFVAEVARLLRSAQNLLQHGAEKLRVPFEAVSEEALSERVAEEMMRRGVEATEVALSTMVLGIHRDIAKKILDFAASTWIDEKAAGRVARAFSAPGNSQPVCLNAAELDTATRYFHVAGYPTARHPGWKTHVCRVSGVQPEDLGKSLVTEIRKLAANKLCCDPSELDRELKEHPHDEKPLVMVLPWPPPHKSALAAVRKDLPDIRLALLAGPSLDPAARAFCTSEGIVLVEPLIAENEEKDTLRALRRATASLEQSYDAA
ncbi:MAG: serine protease [Polyangiaceae bacterium]